MEFLEGGRSLLPHNLRIGVKTVSGDDTEFDSRPSGRTPTVADRRPRRSPSLLTTAKERLVGARLDGRCLQQWCQTPFPQKAMAQTIRDLGAVDGGLVNNVEPQM